MYAVGKVGTFFAQSVYTVSGPFHPFGGAVDIIVVQQEDGTFKTSPWYVKFGKFQGVLKRREKKVVVGVNDSDADFHMYLDHKGEAYFLKDAQGEGEVATFSPPEATSSGDENSSHILALEYPRVEEGANSMSEQLGKEESEDDLELRFEGRDASKQLIQKSVEERATAAAAAAAAGVGGEEIIIPQGNYSGGVDIEIQESPRAEEGFISDQKSPGSQSDVEVGRKTESSNAKIVHALLNKAVGLEAKVKSSPASALLANAAYSAVLESSLKNTDNASSKQASTKVRRTASSNGVIVHGLLNQAIGLQPSHRSGPASRLIAAAALSSLKKAVSDVELDSFSKTPHPHAQLVQLPDGDLDWEKKHAETIPGSPVVELKEESAVDISTSNPNTALSFASNGNTSDDVLMMKTVRNIGSVSESETDQSDVEVSIQSDPILPSRTTEFFEVMKTLEVKKVEILENTLVVEVEEHVEKESLGSIGDEEVKDISDAEGRVEKIVIDRKQVMETVNNLQGSSGANLPVGNISSKAAQALELAYEQAIIPEEVSKLVSVHVDKALVENLEGALTPKTAGDSQVTSGMVKDITTPGKEVAILSSGNAQDVRSPEVPTPGQELPIDSSRKVALTTAEDVLDTPDISTPGRELALQNQVNFSNVNSPRQKAAIELETAWREVMEKAATTLKGAPYTSKRLNHSQSYKKKGLESGQKNADSQGRLPGQSEKKTWGGWWWGGSTAPQVKQTGEQGSSKERRDVQGELDMEDRDLDFDNTELGDPSGVTSELEDVPKRGTQLRHDVEGSDSIVEAEEKGNQSGSDSALPEGTKAGTANLAAKVKQEDSSELASDNKVQQKGVGETPSRRMFFGLLSRTNANQSSLSSASSLRSNDDVEPMNSDGLKRNTSFESADSVVDLLDEKWARGSETRRARVEGRIIATTTAKEVDNNGSLLSSAEPDRGSRSDGSNHFPDSSSILETTEAETAVTPLNGTQCENLSLSAPNLDQGLVNDGDAETEEDGSGNQEGIKVTTNGLDIETASTSVLPDNSPSDLPCFSDMDVLLMSVDGHLVRAPLGLDKDEAPLVADDSAKIKRGGNSSQKLVCFAAEPEDRPSLVSPDAHTLTRNGVEREMLFQRALEDSDGHVPHDPVDSKTVSPRCEGLKGLAKLLEHNDAIGAGQHKILSLDAKTVAAESAPPDQLGPSSESGEAPKENVPDESRTEDVVDKEFDDMRAMVFEKLEEPGDGDALDTDHGQVERYFSSKDLTQAEEEQEKRIFRRSVSVYMDAISGEDEQDSADSDHENDMNQVRDKSGPIGIPGARDSARNFSSETDMHILRSASESLPNERLKLVDPEMLSPRLTLSRSLDSAPPPLVLSTLSNETREQSAASDSLLLAARPSTGSPVKIPVDASASERTPEKVKEDLEQPRGQKSTAATSSSSMDDGGKGSSTGFELSLCRHLLKENMGVEAAARAFKSECVTLDDFKKSGSAIAANDKLVVRVGGRYYPWAVAAPIVLGILAFGKVLIAPNEGAIAVEQPIVVFDGKPATTTSTAISSGGWKLWPPWGSIRRPKTPERAVLSREAMMVATEAALKSNLTQEYLRMAGYYMRPRKVRTNSPSSPQLASLNLKEGSNKITFTFETRVWGKQQVDARIYLWKWNTRIVISDVDGTITKSDVLGQVMPLMGKDWTQIGVARLFSAIKKNGYELMFLSARAISQAYLTRQFLENIKQDGEALPDGPVVISPDGLFPSLYREVIRRAPHEFKIACLEDIKSLFPPESKPFYAGFGNRDTDELSYLKVGIPKGKIFIINPKGEVVVNNQVDVKSYTSLHKLVDDMFPAMTFTEQEDYNEWNFWKMPLPELDDEPSVKSVGSSSSRKSGKSGRLS